MILIDGKPSFLSHRLGINLGVKELLQPLPFLDCDDFLKVGDLNSGPVMIQRRS
jgi:hypothetical protein